MKRPDNRLDDEVALFEMLVSPGVQIVHTPTELPERKNDTDVPRHFEEQRAQVSACF